MAIINCVECGKEISDTAKKCPHCGYNYNSFSKTFRKNAKTIILITVALILIVISICVFMIDSRPNLKIEDFVDHNNENETLFLLGRPTEKDGTEWAYDECDIKFYDIPVKRLWYDIATGEYILQFDDEYNDELLSVMSKHSSLDDVVSGFYVYVHGNMKLWLSLDDITSYLHVHKK